MGIAEILLVSVGLSLDVFVVHVCAGAGFSRLDKKRTAMLCALFAGAQFGAVLLGNLLARLSGSWKRAPEGAAEEWKLLSALIFIGLGFYMFYKAKRKEEVFERRNDKVNWRRMRFLAVLTSVDAFLAGIGFGLCGADIGEQLLILMPVIIFQVILGTGIGYWLGCEYMRKAYGIGGILLFIAGLDVVFTCVI